MPPSAHPKDTTVIAVQAPDGTGYSLQLGLPLQVKDNAGSLHWSPKEYVGGNVSPVTN